MKFAAWVAVLVLLMFQPLHAATITIETTDVTDPHRCNLADAARAASEDRRAGSCEAGESDRTDTLVFSEEARGRHLLQGPLLLLGDIELLGPGAEDLEIDGGALSVEPGDGRNFSMRGVTMRKGMLLRDAREVQLSEVRFDAIVYPYVLHAGAVSVPGSRIQSLRIEDCLFQSVEGELGTVTVTDGAMLDLLEIERSRFVNNHAHGSGAGAVYLDAYVGQARIHASDFLYNEARSGMAGAIADFGDGSLIVSASTLASNEGAQSGALFKSRGELRVLNSALFRNEGELGAALLIEDGVDADLRFSAVFDNGLYTYAPALEVGDGAQLMLQGNMLRAARYGLPVCSGYGIQSGGFNHEYRDASCDLYSQGDQQYVSAPVLRVVAGPGRPAVPASSIWGPGVDRIWSPYCLDRDYRPVVADLRGMQRPAWAQGAVDPSAPCDVGPVELRAGDTWIGYWY